MKKRTALLLIIAVLCIGWDWESNWKADGPQADDIQTDTTYFDGNLSVLDENVQTALETLDELDLSGGLTVPQVIWADPSNYVEDKFYDADATTLAEMADVMASLIVDLKAAGVLSDVKGFLLLPNNDFILLSNGSKIQFT